MALAEETPRVLHQGNGTRGPFSLSVGGTPITFADSEHIRVTRFSAAGAPTTQVEGTHYDLSASSVLPPVGQDEQTVSAATLTFKLTQSVLAGGDDPEFVLIERVSPRTQDVILTTGGRFNSAANERGYDAIVRMIQELEAKVNRGLALSDLDTLDVGANGPVKLTSSIQDLDGKIIGVEAQELVGFDVADFMGATGATGAAGANGSLWHVGSGAPSSGTGANGDYYLNLSNGDVYGPKASGAWGSVAGNIAGPNGPGTGDMLKADNLSGLASAATARTNLGLGSAALLASSAVFQVANNLSEGVASTMRSNLGLGSAALLASSAVAQTANNLSDLANAATARTNLGLGSIAVMAEATTAQIRAGTTAKALSTDKVWASAEAVTLTDAATIVVNMSNFLNAQVTLGGNRTLGQPTNVKYGQSGYILIIQDGTGNRTLAYHSDWKFAGGSDPVLSTAAGAVDVLYYQYLAPNFIFGSLVKGLA